MSIRDEVIVKQQQEIERLKKLLREVCVRANIIFPEEAEEIDMFDEQFANQGELMINIGVTLGLGEIDEEAAKDNAKRLKIIQDQFNSKP